MEYNEVFVAPPFAPIFEPTEEEFQNPMIYFRKIMPLFEHTGICKIRPPANFQPPFAVDVDSFTFTPRIQRLCEVGARSRVRLKFFNRLSSYWSLNSLTLRVPLIEGKPLDFYALHNLVSSFGGYEQVMHDKRWGYIAGKLGYDAHRASSVKNNYDKFLLPYVSFLTQAHNCRIKEEFNIKLEKKPIKPEVPPPSVSKSRYGGVARRSARHTNQESCVPSNEDVLNNPELKKLQFYGPGPRMSSVSIAADSSALNRGKRAKTDENIKCEINVDSPSKRTRQQSMDGVTPCNICKSVQSLTNLLICHVCQNTYHSFCISANNKEKPSSQWRCPPCVYKYIHSGDYEKFGFQQSKDEYTLQGFGEMADAFKQDHFKKPAHMVPYDVVEREYWRLVASLDEDVSVLYGADLYTVEHGSGFPSKNSDSFSKEDAKYLNSGWNLNNLAVEDKSIMRFIKADISGMKIPWIYIGMCFSTFCWHVEDHWSPSVNYLHWGEPKTWYGVAYKDAEKLETTMKNAAPELFDNQPDLMHQLVTSLNPMELQNNGIKVHKINQCAGEFVVTYPRAYHAGFNQGYNCAEAVNFLPIDWLPIGRECINHYKAVKRACVFSQDELICAIVNADADIDYEDSKEIITELQIMIDDEEKARGYLKDSGVRRAEIVKFEEVPDDYRQCELCLTTCFLSSLTCPCKPGKMVCSNHFKLLCSCDPAKKILKYRYSLDEMIEMFDKLRSKSEYYDTWLTKVTHALEAWPGSKLSLNELNKMVKEADVNRFPDSPELQSLKIAVSESEKFVRVAHSFLSKNNNRSLVTIEQLGEFLIEIQALPCELEENELVQERFEAAENIEARAKKALDSDCTLREAEKLIKEYSSIEVTIPTCAELEQLYKEKLWLENVQNFLKNKRPLKFLAGLVESGQSYSKSKRCTVTFAKIASLFEEARAIERDINIELNTRCSSIENSERMLKKAASLPIDIMGCSALEKRVSDVKKWVDRTSELLSDGFFTVSLLTQLIDEGSEISPNVNLCNDLISIRKSLELWTAKLNKIFLIDPSDKFVDLYGPTRDFDGSFSTTYHEIYIGFVSKLEEEQCRLRIENKDCLEFEGCILCRNEVSSNSDSYLSILCSNCNKTRRPSLKKINELLHNPLFQQITCPEYIGLSTLINFVSEWQMKAETAISNSPSRSLLSGTFSDFSTLRANLYRSSFEELSDDDERLAKSLQLYLVQGFLLEVELPEMTDLIQLYTTLCSRNSPKRSRVKPKRVRSRWYRKKRCQRKSGSLSNGDSPQEDDAIFCADRMCKGPCGDDIGWVQCDSCQAWYHLDCVNISQYMAQEEDYKCATCLSEPPTSPTDLVIVTGPEPPVKQISSDSYPLQCPGKTLSFTRLFTESSCLT